ncbi:hypothetical protein G7072_19495 [Nocardioides sp. HDW12B]|uniref:DUF6458 family protein n=1 Tax=Nocardioides sp. HDW12B TaxID=2714939 RepID=UPI0014078494|nr:DUF6458 family protein [Nocardioides sp. HDW12B]QIK68233.1 hypothetical protein G7072_19495 [Nocardioides sp. HDW12B]
MGLGLGVVLIVLGLLFVTPVISYDIPGVDDIMLGWILVGAGVLSIVLGLVATAQRSRTTHVEERRTH